MKSVQLSIFILIAIGLSISGCLDETEEILGINDDVLFVEEPFVPSDASGLMMWLDASDPATLFTDATCEVTFVENDGDPIGCWKDKSGNSFHGTQAVADRRPELALGIQNGLNGIYFQDSNNENFQIPSGSWQSGSEFSAYIVYFQETTDEIGTLFATANGALTDFAMTSRPLNGTNKNKYLDHSIWRYSSTNTAGDWNIDAFNRSGANMSYYLDGLLDGQFNGLTNPSPSIATIGSYTNNTNVLNGHIAEILWYSNSLNNLDRQKVEGYLAHKWGLAFQLPSDHPYREKSPNTDVQVSL